MKPAIVAGSAPVGVLTTVQGAAKWVSTAPTDWLAQIVHRVNIRAGRAMPAVRRAVDQSGVEQIDELLIVGMQYVPSVSVPLVDFSTLAGAVAVVSILLAVTVQEVV